MLDFIYPKLPKITFVVISVLIAYQAASLSWLVLPSQKASITWNRPAVKAHIAMPGAGNNNVSKNLFGTAEKKQIKAIEKTNQKNAPKTQLNLTLVGIISASDPAYSSAIITYRGQQDSYFVDSQIDGTSAKVTAIYADHLILDVNGNSQTLMLDGREYKATNEVSQTVPQIKSSHERKLVKLDRKAILRNPGKLTDYIRISPVRKDGNVLGYRVRPGRDRSVFEGAGLISGDIAIELNGVDLTDMQQAFTLMKEFPTMTEMSLTVNRNGQLHELFFSIPE